jgi:GTP-binding protein EngB required for normal cell division
MKNLTVYLQVLALAACVALLASRAVVRAQDEDEGMRLPSGKSQKEAIVEDDYKKNLEDAKQLVDLAERLKARLEKDERYVVSATSIKNTEEIERLARQIRGRLRRY